MFTSAGCIENSQTGGFEMSLSEFQRRVPSLHVSGADRTWFPKWLAGYADYVRTASDQPLAVDHERVVGFLRSLRDNRIPAWRRLQAARAIEAYQATVLRTDGLSFEPIKSKLRELARLETTVGSQVEGYDPKLVTGEGNAGRMDDREPEAIRKLRGRLRVLHHKRSTEKAYVNWVRRLIRHLDDDRVHQRSACEGQHAPPGRVNKDRGGRVDGAASWPRPADVPAHGWRRTSTSRMPLTSNQRRLF